MLCFKKSFVLQKKPVHECIIAIMIVTVLKSLHNALSAMGCGVGGGGGGLGLGWVCVLVTSVPLLSIVLIDVTEQA